MKLNNPIKDIYKKLEAQFGVIKIPQGDVDRATERTNAQMEEYAREFRYKCAKSEEEAMHHYFNF
ncbi:MAG: hypothetical protein M1416_01810 [Candidatus Pacearchaeota archaeon]|nr:hypothetical protein [Candidatus Pacearchaeota archaeon]